MTHPTDEALLRQAVRVARPRYRASPRWVAVMDTFTVGSTVARKLCARFDVEPDERVSSR